MKFLKHILGILFLSMVLFNSCQNENQIDLNEHQFSNQEKIAVQTLLSEFNSQLNNDTSSSFNPDNLCFQFVYPIQLTYNTLNNITVNNWDGFKEVLESQTPNQYVVGIVMPFQIVMDNVTQTISTEDELVNLIESCDFFSVNDDIVNTFCFDIVFPIHITAENGQQVTINTIQEFLNFLTTQTNGYQSEIVFPIVVIKNGETLTINSLFEFYELVDSCNNPSDGCVCPQVYSPVCIQTPNGVMEFGNMCYAECAGYTQADVVPCNNGFDCNIFDLQVSVGNCNNDGTYALTVDFNYNNSPNALFDVFTRNNVRIGTYPLSQLPITIGNFPDSDFTNDFIRVSINDTNDCSAVAEWQSPNCDATGCNCYTQYEPVCVRNANGELITFSNPCFAQCEGYTPNDFVNCNPTNTFNFAELLGTCFTIQYPVQVNPQGNTLITVNSDQELLNFYYPNMNPVPVMVYPITLTFMNPATGNLTVSVNSEAGLIELIRTHCH